MTIPGEPFDLVLDVGGNIGLFAEYAIERWPDARVISFEPVPQLASMNVQRAQGRWVVWPLAVSDRRGFATLYACRNQGEASTMMEPGTTRQREFGIIDSWQPISVSTCVLDDYLQEFGACERGLVKIDVEGHELNALRGARDVLTLATTAIVECQQDRDIFIDAPSPAEIDEELRRNGLAFAGILSTTVGSSGRVLQFDGVWSREN